MSAAYFPVPESVSPDGADGRMRSGVKISGSLTASLSRMVWLPPPLVGFPASVFCPHGPVPLELPPFDHEFPLFPVF